MELFSKKVEKKGKDKRKVRPLLHFITYRMCGIEACLCGVGILFVILYCLARIDNKVIDGICSIVKGILSFINDYKSAIDSLTYSIIPACLVYLVTVIIPESKRSQAMLPSICERLRYIKDEFYDLSDCLANCNWIDHPDYLNKAFENVTNFSTTKNSNSYSLHYCNFFLQLFVENLDKHADFILQYHNELSPKEMRTLLEIKFSSIFGKIREDHFSVALFDKESFNKVIQELRTQNIKAISLYEKLCNRVYINI